MERICGDFEATVHIDEACADSSRAAGGAAEAAFAALETALAEVPA